MLVLSRKINEEVMIGDDIIIKIISIQNGIVKIGFEAPQNKVILRGELKKAIIGENLKASSQNSYNSLPNLCKIIKQ
ncbi:carbon storage regulator CsrA [Helicobacter sp. MIT 14-3879]|uniref:carbon storage regulator CsrA n=1 Tax=Helicobacter sp. MIT 14-3879 TaxID=2040649 RepID=UPI000E1F26A2|nr:carbon storage regulator CsrA [Helicobacter sp. MIT 14-3879]RDU63535.1 carbon storage regulator [Helicobacter sp. MIT 14-3879]